MKWRNFSWHQRLIQRLAWTRSGAWLIARTLHHTDKITLRLTRDGYCLTTFLTGQQVFWLTTTGAKTGKSRTVPLLGVKDGDKVVFFATSFGAQRHPGWYYNLQANPNAELASANHNGKYTAASAAGAERQNYWSLALELYPGYAAYAQRAGERRIPVMVLSPDFEAKG